MIDEAAVVETEVAVTAVAVADVVVAAAVGVLVVVERAILVVGVFNAVLIGLAVVVDVDAAVVVVVTGAAVANGATPSAKFWPIQAPLVVAVGRGASPRHIASGSAMEPCTHCSNTPVSGNGKLITHRSITPFARVTLTAIGVTIWLTGLPMNW